MLRPQIKSSISSKLLINIGAMMDIPTGAVITGKKGESIINGGLGLITAVVGRGNHFKSTILHYMMLSAADKVFSSYETLMQTYDTEINISPERLMMLAERFDYIPKEGLLDPETGAWMITDKSQYYADEWLDIIRNFTNEKTKDKSLVVKNTPFNTEGVIIPSFTEVDSLSEFESANTVEMADKNSLGDSSTNTLFMKQGLVKSKFLMELPRLAMGSNNYFLMTAHVGKDINMAAGPYAPQPEKKLQHLKGGDKIKGVSDKFYFLVSNLWYAYNAAPLVNQNTKTAEYPKTQKMNKDSDPMELNIVSLRQLRSKSGPSGYTISLIVSQNEGVLPTLSEFHTLKSNGRFGIGGSLQNYFMVLRPDVSLSRTTVREKIDNDPMLRRAIQITSELAQIKQFWPHMVEDGLWCEPEELYEGLKKQGYDWDELLSTRGWWALNQYDHPVPFLSTVDLLKMYKGTYTPYWMDKKK